MKIKAEGLRLKETAFKTSAYTLQPIFRKKFILSKIFDSFVKFFVIFVVKRIVVIVRHYRKLQDLKFHFVSFVLFVVNSYIAIL
ncbi:MAG: hypothetical protein AB1422_01475 [bacterium]